MTGVEWSIVVFVVFLGACAQGSIGFGLGMIAAPFLAMIEPTLVPVPLLIVAGVLAVLVGAGERGSLNLGELKWALVGRVPGSVLGTAAVVVLPERGMMIALAVLLLVGVTLSLTARPVEPAPVTLVTAGALSGLMGSVTSVGGPPMALLYQRRSGAQLRATLSLFFVVGTAVSITLLAAAGEVGRVELRRAAVLLAPVVAGFVVSRRLGGVLDRGGRLRPILLSVSAAAAVVVLVDALLTG